MGFSENVKETKERRKVKSTTFKFELLGIFLAMFFVFVFFARDFTLTDIFFYSPSKYPFIAAGLVLIVLSIYFYYYPNVMVNLLDKLKIYPFIEKILIKPLKVLISWFFSDELAKKAGDYVLGKKSKIKDLEEFFYKAPKQNDYLPREKEEDFKVFKGKTGIDEIFAFDIKNPEKEDEESFKRIVGLFRGENENEKFSKYKDYFCVIEGFLKDYFKKGLETKKINPPVSIVKNEVKIDLTKDVYDFKNDKIYISGEMLEETLKTVSFLFYRYVETSLKMPTKIKRLYANSLADEKVLNKVFDLFKFFYLRKLLLNYFSIPSGLIVIRADDYDFRRIASTIDREVLVILKDNNVGGGENNDDRFTNMFLFLWHSFFEKSVISRRLKDIDYCFNTLKNLSDIKIKRKIEDIESLIEKEIEESENES